MTQLSLFTPLDLVDLTTQEEAVLAAIRQRGWSIAYELVGKQINGTTIGDAGRRMRNLRDRGILTSRKRGRYEEYNIHQ